MLRAILCCTSVATNCKRFLEPDESLMFQGTVTSRGREIEHWKQETRN